MRQLFDNLTKRKVGHKNYSESNYSFLNCAADPWLSEVRNTLESWFKDYPAADKTDLAGRFRSDDYLDHIGALTELLVFRLLMRLGAEVTIHPEDGGTHPYKPDFKVKFKNGSTCYVEVATTDGQSKEDRKHESRENVVYDAINRLDSPDYFISVSVVRYNNKQPNAGKMSSFLKSEISKLNYQDVISSYEEKQSIESLPHWRCSVDGWEIDFGVIPKKPEFRGLSNKGCIGALSYGAECVNPQERVRSILEKKAEKLKGVAGPLLIVINQVDCFSDKSSDRQALFGDEAIEINIQTKESRPKRKYNGFWLNTKGPRKCRVGGVLFLQRLVPASIKTANLELYVNPWAKQSLPTGFEILPRTIVDGVQIKHNLGKSLSEIL